MYTTQLIIDITKDELSSLMYVDNYVQPVQFRSLTYGEVFDFGIRFTENGVTSSINTDESNSITCYISDLENGLLAYSNDISYQVNYGYTGSISLATTNLSASLIGKNYIESNFIVEVVNATYSTKNIYLRAPVLIYNNLLEDIIAIPVGTGSFYNVSQSNALFVKYTDLYNWTGSTNADRGLYRNALSNSIGFASDTDYPTGSIPYASDASSIRLSSGLTYNGAGTLTVANVAGTASNATLSTTAISSSHAVNADYAAGWLEEGTEVFTSDTVWILNTTNTASLYVQSTAAGSIINLVTSNLTTRPASIFFKQTSTQYGKIQYAYPNLILGNLYNNTGNIIFLTKTGSVESNRLVILNNGNVGIGYDEPSYKLSVNGDTYIAGNLYATASHAISASWAPDNNLIDGNTYYITSSHALTASYYSGSQLTAVTSSYATTSSLSDYSKTASFVAGNNVSGVVVSASYLVGAGQGSIYGMPNSVNVGGDIIPASSSYYNLGNTSSYFNKVYSNQVVGTTDTASYVSMQSGSYRWNIFVNTDGRLTFQYNNTNVFSINASGVIFEGEN